MCVAHSTVSVRWWRVLWARCFVTWCGTYSTEPSKSRMSGSPDVQSLGREAFSLRPLPLQNRIRGSCVNLAAKQKEWRRSWPGNIVLTVQGFLSPQVFGNSLFSAFSFSGLPENCCFSDGSLPREQPMVLHAFPAWSVRRLQHVFICCLLDQLPACGFQVGSNQLVGLHSPFWVWAGVPFHSLWSSSCVDSGVSFLKYTTWSYKYRRQACRRPCMAVVSL